MSSRAALAHRSFRLLFASSLGLVLAARAPGPLAAAVGTPTAIWTAVALVAAATLAALAVAEVRDLPRADVG